VRYRTNSDGGGIVTEVIAPTVPVGKWTRISVAVAARSGSPSAAGVTLSVGSLGKRYQLEPEALSTTFRGDVGLGTTNPAGAAWTVYYDNVTIFEYGIALWKTTWRESGAIKKDYRLEAGDEAYQRVLKYRALYKKDVSSERG